MNRDNKVVIDQALWLRVPTVCEKCAAPATATLLVVTEGREWIDGDAEAVRVPLVLMSLTALPALLQEQLSKQNPGIFRFRRESKRPPYRLNHCPACEYPIDEDELVEAGSPFRPGDIDPGFYLEAMLFAPVPTCIYEADTWESPAIGRIARRTLPLLLQPSISDEEQAPDASPASPELPRSTS